MSARLDDLFRLAPDPPRAGDRSEAERLLPQRSLRARDPRDAGPRHRPVRDAGGYATKWTESPRAAAHSPSWNGSNAFAAWSGGKCGVTWTILIGGRGSGGGDRGGIALSNSVNVTGDAPRVSRAYSKKRSRRSQKAASSASVLLYGLPPTMASLEWKRRFSTGSPASDEIAREADHVVERRIGRPQPAHPRHAELPEHALRRVVARRPRVEILQPLRHRPVQRGGHRDLQHAAGARPRRAVVGQEVGPERRFDEVRPVLVRLVEERRHARLDPVAELFQRRHVRGGEPEPAGAVRHRPLARRRPRWRRSARRADPRTGAAAGWRRTGAA